MSVLFLRYTVIFFLLSTKPLPLVTLLRPFRLFHEQLPQGLPVSTWNPVPKPIPRVLGFCCSISLQVPKLPGFTYSCCIKYDPPPAQVKWFKVISGFLWVWNLQGARPGHSGSEPCCHLRQAGSWWSWVSSGPRAGEAVCASGGWRCLSPCGLGHLCAVSVCGLVCPAFLGHSDNLWDAHCPKVCVLRIRHNLFYLSMT